MYKMINDIYVICYNSIRLNIYHQNPSSQMLIYTSVERIKL